ncbi:MAG: NfeD family protein [Desulfovibrio sp.]|nr:NfeD family protein [Desulfovibrio sp.]
MSGVVWFLIGIGFFLTEMFVPAFVMLFFGIGAWATAVITFFTPLLEMQALCFILSSLISLIFIRNRLRSVFSGQSRKPSGQLEHPMTGRRGVVSKRILPNEIGEISSGGSYWRAVSESDIPEGSQVKVNGVLANDGIILCVTLSTDTEGE